MYYGPQCQDRAAQLNAEETTGSWTYLLVLLCSAPYLNAQWFVCVVQLRGHGQAGALGHVQKKSAPVSSMSVGLRRHLQLVPMWPDVWGVRELAGGKLVEEWAEEMAPFVQSASISCWRQGFAG